ncbi:MAG: hypothetical protein CMG66_06650 [Candidatus Marinimicrobia bacterium]|nr:hypothetical protein [Candidatus Neomarinimicrobiota bacterium]|tara:strand:- start:25657 stop:26490 length:834 start_codon:yes stop_codon:yes gene_type:complete
MEYVDCILCRSNKSSYYKKIKEPLKSTYFTLVKCNDCRLIYLNPRPDESEIIKYYTSSYLPHRKDKSPFIFIYSLIQKAAFFWKYKLILKHSPRCKKILDYGGGNGSFSSYLNKLEIDTINYDPHINDKLKIADYIENKKFDVITLWHAMEHIHDIKTTFSHISESLKEDGILMIAIPNHDAYERKTYYRNNWVAYDVPRHLYHFTFNTFEKLIKKHNFYIEDFHVMYQDTFFNTLMSFKGKNLIKLIYRILETLFNIYKNRKLSSSLLFICKRKSL